MTSSRPQSAPSVRGGPLVRRQSADDLWNDLRFGGIAGAGDGVDQTSCHQSTSSSNNGRPATNCEDILHCVQKFVFQRRVRVRGIFHDYDRLNCGRCTRWQFSRALSHLVPTLTETDLVALTDFFEETGPHVQPPQVISYVRFQTLVDEVFAAPNLEKRPGAHVPPPGGILPPDVVRTTLPPDEEKRVHEVLARIAKSVSLRGIHLRQSFDAAHRSNHVTMVNSRNSGKVTPSQFVKHFPLSGEVCEADMSLLLRRYETSCGGVSCHAFDEDITCLVDQIVARTSSSPADASQTPTTIEHQGQRHLQSTETVCRPILELQPEAEQRGRELGGVLARPHSMGPNAPTALSAGLRNGLLVARPFSVGSTRQVDSEVSVGPIQSHAHCVPRTLFSENIVSDSLGGAARQAGMHRQLISSALPSTTAALASGMIAPSTEALGACIVDKDQPTVRRAMLTVVREKHTSQSAVKRSKSSVNSRELALQSSPQLGGALAAQGRDLKALAASAIEKIARAVTNRGVRLHDRFLDFDKKRCGACTRAAANAVLTVLGITLEPTEYDALFEHFFTASIGGDNLINYRDLCVAADLQSAPPLRVIDKLANINDTACGTMTIENLCEAVRQPWLVSGSERGQGMFAPQKRQDSPDLVETLEFMRRRLRLRRFDMRKVFRDILKASHSAYITKVNFCRVLDMAGFRLKREQMDALHNAYCDRDDEPEKVNYLAFCAAMEVKTPEEVLIHQQQTATQTPQELKTYFDCCGRVLPHGSRRSSTSSVGCLARRSSQPNLCRRPSSLTSSVS